MNNREIQELIARTRGADGKKSESHERQEFFIPIHGFTWFYPEEVMVINHPAFQRLGQISQLGASHWVYRGATHKRIEHSMGTVAVAQKILDAVTHNCLKAKNGLHPHAVVSHPPTDEERRFTRLAALLHDIGHLPFGHTFEDELRLISKHDSRERFNTVFDTDYNCQECEEEVPTLRELIRNLYHQNLPTQSPVQPDELLLLVLTTKTNEIDVLLEADKQTEELKLLKALAAKHFRVAICSDIVSNTISADLLDYIHRDWFHIGRPGFFDERLLQYMEIRGEQHDPKELEPLITDRFLVSLGEPPRIRTDGISAILALLESRYNLAEAVIFHRTKMNAMSLLERALNLCAFPEQAKDNFKALLEKWLLEITEDSFINQLAEGRGPLFKELELMPEEAKRVKKLGLRIKRRDYYETLYLISSHETDLITKHIHVQQCYATKAAAPANRAMALDLLEQDFRLPKGSITMYCPDPQMNAKIARVRIFFDGHVGTLNDLEEKGFERNMTGGHLKAQITRFNRLWRVAFFINPTVLPKNKRERDDFRNVIKSAIKSLVLGLPDSSGISSENAAHTVAGALCKLPLWQDYTVSDKLVSGTKYPSGYPTLNSVITPKPATIAGKQYSTELVTKDEVIQMLQKFQPAGINADRQKSIEIQVERFVNTIRTSLSPPQHSRLRTLFSTFDSIPHPERNRLYGPHEILKGLEFLASEVNLRKPL